MPDAPATLLARTIRLDADVDLLDVAGRDGFLFEQAGTGLAGRGVALRLPLPTGPGRLVDTADLVGRALAAIEVDDGVGCPGTGPVAFAALPFSASTPGDVVVPALVVGRSADGTRWLTSIGPPGHVPPTEVGAPRAPAAPCPSAFVVRSGRPPDEWCGVVAGAVTELRAGAYRKVVLAREVVVEADAPHDPVVVLGRLRAAFSSSIVYAVEGFVGASPELLVSRTGDVVRSQPMAGTAPRTGDPLADARLAASLLASAKDRAEHQITIDTVLDTLLGFCSYADVEPEPSVVPLANVQHLASLVEGRLSSPAAPILQLVAALHPTPAVCGWPRQEALDAIARHEGFDRGRYAGAVGWVDGRGDGRFAVAVRCAELDGRRARLMAGNGIVADSDPATELAETRAKFQAVLAAVVRP